MDSGSEFLFQTWRKLARRIKLKTRSLQKTYSLTHLPTHLLHLLESSCWSLHVIVSTLENAARRNYINCKGGVFTFRSPLPILFFKLLSKLQSPTRPVIFASFQHEIHPLACWSWCHDCHGRPSPASTKRPSALR